MKPLQLKEVVKQYGDKTAVNSLSLEVDEGEIYGLLGANGAGKTTTMRMVLGLIYPDGGSIRYNGKPFHEGLSRILGYLPEERGMYPKIKVSEQVVYLAQLRGMSRKEADSNLKYWLERFNVPENYNKKIEELSKGNQQKVGFIASIVHKPKLLILDEAFSGLDPVNVELLKETVKELRDQGTSILFSTHRMEHVEELCRNLTILQKGNAVLQGSLRELKSHYPREHIILRTGGPVEGLQNITGVSDVKRTDDGYRLRITDESVAQTILHVAMTQTSVQQFELKEPTLNEIFIKAVGGESNA
ncbi:ABC transporter ATP-binding protein [Aneurinibacillus aneurinilyticus]|jgi:ABC-2 type transport system ATP-binding protein|uniref:ABC transporter ATP-binding protein n=2 Tax=Aneurinibacillus aneurinilyticus TaxID=1391 RepID=A0A848D374_ANEAE|nr:ABC transporter ATP-binding protein [Aneurinibacillus aneurinilyticus]ERI09536.1 ABC transporter, ATP-binding protein [Aneurinibacillus aneurinilyticus ATCC 12856]MCI1695729.1 ABC transporter ATP-binding protein [Aneurinibacillus aneurinilyticus]MED0670712.1 ABC transporter ATP-binding protein [Aneurinibacillus aneurinilyticus]MED0706703.1 ABC transporter ATP-binding protein [Aneurinibacillus aneurinilyticus]MED0722577.1 ABC transporter ATP-binding protein [Aneurinibacillus aneurinilyticus]